VLPLAPRDFERARRLLLPSLAKNMTCLATVYVVVPDDEVAVAREVFSPFGDFRVVPEYDLVPIRQGRRQLSGWLRQQLCKLEAHRLIRHDFYLTLDADVICVRPVTESDLVVNGRAITQIRVPNPHPHWSDWSARVLGLPMPAYGPGVTPAVLHRESVRGLLAYLAQRNWRWRRAVDAALPHSMRARLGWGSAVGYLFRHQPWTEYTLYFGYLEAIGTRAEVHALDAGEPLYGNCVWRDDSLSDFDADAAFGGTGSFFSVIQSNNPAPLADVVTAVAPYLN
jgi:hypothetical protein